MFTFNCIVMEIRKNIFKKGYSSFISYEESDCFGNNQLAHGAPPLYQTAFFTAAFNRGAGFNEC